MSTLKVNTIQDTTGNDALTIDSSGNVTASQGFVPSTQLSHRNLIINGAMQVAQRGTSFTQDATAQYTVDRFKAIVGSSFDWNSTITQSSTAPSGFSNSIKVYVDSTSTPSGGNNAVIGQYIESQNLQQLGYGTSSAKTMTLSFWVKSNKTGTYCLQLANENTNTGVLYEYAISSADTWEQKTINIDGDTSGSFNNDNASGLLVAWHLSAGSSDHISATSTWSSSAGGALKATSNQVNLMDTVANDWFLTGVQLEVGSVATPFEHRSYGEELTRCERYYQIAVEGSSKVFAMGTIWSNNAHYGVLYFRPMRTTPTFTDTTGSGYYRFRSNGSSYNHSDMGFADITAYSCMIYGDGSGGTNGEGGWWDTNSASAKISLDAEL